MKTICENCGQPALDNDIVCWQCGRPIPGRESLTEEGVQIKESWQDGISLFSVGTAVAMTILVIVAALLVLWALGRQPIVQVRFGTKTPPRYVQFTAGDKRFTVDLPDTWQWLDASRAEQAAGLEALLVGDSRYLSGTFPAGAELDDLAISFVAWGPAAAGDGEQPFMVVGLSESLNRISSSQALSALQNESDRVEKVVFVDDYNRSHLLAEVRIMAAGEEDKALGCRQQFFRGDRETMLAVYCAPAGRFGVYQATIDNMAGSMQRLAP